MVAGAGLTAVTKAPLVTVDLPMYGYGGVDFRIIQIDFGLRHRGFGNRNIGIGLRETGLNVFILLFTHRIDFHQFFITPDLRALIDLTLASAFCTSALALSYAA